MGWGKNFYVLELLSCGKFFFFFFVKVWCKKMFFVTHQGYGINKFY